MFRCENIDSSIGSTDVGLQSGSLANSVASDTPALVVIDLTNHSSFDSSANRVANSSIDDAHLSSATTFSKNDSSFAISANSSSADASHVTSNMTIDSSRDSTSKKRVRDTVNDSTKDKMIKRTKHAQTLTKYGQKWVSTGMSGRSLDYPDDDEWSEQSILDITYPTSIDVNPGLRFLGIEQIFKEMYEIIEHMAELTQLPSSSSRILLNLHKWDKSTLTARYFERTNDEEFFRKHRVVNPFRAIEMSPENTTDECPICLKTSKTIDGEMTRSLCGHTFCNICWDQYLSTKVTDEGIGETISCAAYECNIILDYDFVVGLLIDAAIRLMYNRLIANNFIQLKQDWCWCPSPKCNLAIEVLKVDAIAICLCGERFCHKCFDDWHDPVECKYLKIWKSDDTATFTYLAAKTKECPKCRAPIEKNGGCNHMTCRSCPHQFCWLCLGNWDSHTNCNSYKDNKNVKKAISQNNRHNHFWNRYSEHKNSLKLEQELYNKINEASNIKKSTKEVECFQKGFAELLECRRMLMNTYVFVYYLEDDTDDVQHKSIFEGNQANLELATERLSGLLQNYSIGEGDEESINGICENIKAKYRYCDTRRNNLLEHVKEGNEKMVWRYRQ